MTVPRIYAIADAACWAPRELPSVVEELAYAGWPWVQVRDKSASDRQLLRIAEACMEAVAGTDTRLWINDRADIAAMVGAYGVHLGNDDPPPGVIRQGFPNLRIGRSTDHALTVGEADQDPNVDLVAFGPVFSTETKKGAPKARGIEALDQARDWTDKPMVAIGGIEEFSIPDLRWAGANVVAVAAAIAVSPKVVQDWVSRYAEPESTTEPRVYLTGFMAAGKSCIGRRIAAVLGWGFCDLDTVVRLRAKMTVEEIFSQEGEIGFRTRESEALLQVSSISNRVVACGGGVIDSSDNRRTLRDDDGVVVWLDVDEKQIEKRLQDSSTSERPLATENWRHLLRDRRRRYAETANVVVPVRQAEPVQQTCRRVLDSLELAS